MKITVITIVYNNILTIERTILSVLNQSYNNIEYIIIDGGSTDGTREIIKKYEKYFTYWISEPDKGISDAFNKGIGKATGDIIGLLNADDWYEPNAIQLLVENYSKKFDIYCGNINLIDKNGFVFKRRKSRIGLLNFGMYIMHPTVFVKRQVYETIGLFDTSLKIAMDFDMLLRCKKNNYSFKHINRVLTNMSTEGVSNDVVRMHKEELSVMFKHLSTVEYFFSFSANYVNRIIWKLSQ